MHYPGSKPYQLPATLNLYKTDDTNLPVTGITENINGNGIPCKPATWLLINIWGKHGLAMM